MKSTVAPSYAGYDVTSTVWTRTRDVARAQELLAETEWPEGFSTRVAFIRSGACVGACMRLLLSL